MFFVMDLIRLVGFGCPSTDHVIFSRQLFRLSIYKVFCLTNKEASTVLCSVVKHAGSGRARKKCRGKHETKSFAS